MMIITVCLVGTNIRTKDIKAEPVVQQAPALSA